MRRTKRWLGITAVGIACLVVAVLAVFQLPQFGGQFTGERLERMKKSPQYVDDHFENTPPQNTDNSLIRNFKLYQQGFVREPRFEIPVVQIPATALKEPPDPGMRAYWFGHATVLVEIDGLRFMTDPVLSEYASPFEIGPKRFHPTPIPLSELNGIDAVVISHDHYDHLDMKTVQHLATTGTHFYVGLGIGAHLQRWNVPVAQIHEMDWWETAELKGVRIHCVPSRHYSGRKAMDNSTLWTSWMVRGPKHSSYFSGDTGYGPHFSEIRKRLGAADLALMKVGAYGETWLDIHMSPESAVQASADLGAKVVLPVHWATFDMSYHPWEEPIYRTLEAAAKARLQIITPKVGERFEFGSGFTGSDWYARQRNSDNGRDPSSQR